MKKSALIFIINTLLCVACYAQVSFIPKAGLTFSNVEFDEKLKGQQYKMGLVTGAGFNFPVDANFFSIQPELLFIQKGISQTLVIKLLNLMILYWGQTIIEAESHSIIWNYQYLLNFLLEEKRYKPILMLALLSNFVWVV